MFHIEILKEKWVTVTLAQEHSSSQKVILMGILQTSAHLPSDLIHKFAAKTKQFAAA